MALHDPDLSYQAELDKLTRLKAHLIICACKSGATENTSDLSAGVSDYICDDQAMADLIQNTLKGGNAFRELLDKIALDIGEQQAVLEIAEQSRYNRELADDDRISRYLDSRVRA